MTPERYQQVGQIYRAALEVESDQRAAFLVEACGGDEVLRQDVESLLGYEARSGGIIDQPALEVAARELAGQSMAGAQPQPLADPAPRRIEPRERFAQNWFWRQVGERVTWCENIDE
jgi:hypothetical protein